MIVPARVGEFQNMGTSYFIADNLKYRLVKAPWSGPSHANTDSASWDKVRARRVDIWIPAEELGHRKDTPILRNDIPAGISHFNRIVQVA
jgi:hypothetical protein